MYFFFRRNVNHGVVQVPGENGPYKPSSAGTGPVHNNFVGYPASIRYVSQPVFMSATTTASNVFRDGPFHSRALNVSFDNLVLFYKNINYRHYKYYLGLL